MRINPRMSTYSKKPKHPQQIFYLQCSEYFLALQMEKKRNIGKIAKIIYTVFSTAFIVTLISYLGLNFILHSEEIYYLGIATIALLFPFLLSIAYVMALMLSIRLKKESKD